MIIQAGWLKVAKQTWIFFAYGCLDWIGLVVLEKTILIWRQCHIAIISPWKRARTFNLINLNSLHPTKLCASLVEFGRGGHEKMKTWNYTGRRTDDGTDDQKSSLELSAQVSWNMLYLSSFSFLFFEMKTLCNTYKESEQPKRNLP